VKIAASIIAACVHTSSLNYHLPQSLLWSILKVEGGEVGTVSPNPNGTQDLGPMQINSSWLARFSKWYATAPSFADKTDAQRQVSLRQMITYDPCFNISMGSWIMRQGIDEAGGGVDTFWEGVGYYHSHNSSLKKNYQKLVAKAATRLYGPEVFSDGPLRSPDIAIIPVVASEGAMNPVASGTGITAAAATIRPRKNQTGTFSITEAEGLSPQPRVRVSVNELQVKTVTTDVNEAHPQISCVMGARYSLQWNSCVTVQAVVEPKAKRRISTPKIASNIQSIIASE